jgi:ABC-type bacteriocin/lantibiotic exporter with double-glycine peptidase domain
MFGACLQYILITVLVAQLVVSGQLTLGMMLSVQYIIGQLNGPVDQLIGFIRSMQNREQRQLLLRIVFFFRNAWKISTRRAIPLLSN